MKRPNLEKLTDEERKYVEYLEGRGIPKLQLALANICNLLADDINSVIDGSGGSLNILNIDETSFKRILTIIKNRKDFDSISPVFSEEETTTVKKTKRNIQDFIEKP